MSGLRVFTARSAAHAMTSPTTLPMLPPMNSNAIAPMTTRCVPMVASPASMASSRPLIPRAATRMAGLLKTQRLLGNDGADSTRAISDAIAAVVKELQYA